jgi:Tat protein secretion system quality control protein TatD with DNase activity
MKKQINEIKRMQQLAGIITESEYQEVVNTMDVDILSFLESNKLELLDKLAKKFEWDEDDKETMEEEELGIGADADGNEDTEIAGLGEAGLDFSFNPKKVKDTYGDASNFKLIIAGKPIYGIAYNM